MADRYWVLGGTGVWSSTTNWSTSSGGASGASVPGSADNVIFDRASTYTVSITTGSSCLSFTASAGSPTFTMTNTLSIAGSFNLTGSTTTWTASTSGLFFQNQAGGSATRTINSAGVTIDCPVTVSDNVASTVQLAANFTIGSTRTFTFSAGIAGDILDLNGFTLTCGIFNSSNAITRTLAFGTGKIVCTATGTPWNLTTITGLTVTGTPRVELSYSGSTAMTVQLGSLSQANSISFWFQAGSYSLSFGGTTIRNLDFTGSATTIASGALTIYGNLTLSSTTWSSASTQTFAATSGTQIITSNAQTMDCPITINGVGGTVQLADAMTINSGRTFTLTAGTLDLNGKTLTTGVFSSSNSNTRTIAFGTGNITVTDSGTSVYTTGILTGLTITGTPVVNITYSGSIATQVACGAASEAQAVSFNFTAGTYVLSFLDAISYAAKNISFVSAPGATTGFGGTWATRVNSNTIYGDLTLSSNMTVGSTTPVLVFGATSGTQTITSNTATLDLNVSITGGAIFKLADALTLGVTRSVTLTLGTLDLNNKLLTLGIFLSTNSNTRTIAFGTGSITCSAAGGTLWNTSTPTGLTVTGTSTVNISYSGTTATSVLPGILTEAQAVSFNFTTGTYPLTFLATATYACKNANFTGFAGTWSGTAAGVIYGNLTLATGMTLTASAAIMSFRGTSGTQVITSNSKTIDFPVTFNGIGGTFQLADAMTLGATRQLAHTNGTLNLNGKTLTVGTAYTTAGGTKNLTFNGGTLVCPAASVTAFNNASPTNFTTTAGTGTGKISMTAATAKTFVGGGSTFNCTLSNDGAGALTVSGSNTFTTVANGVQPTAFTFTAATTQTVTNWNVSGTAGNLVTIISSTAGTPALLSKASGTVSSNYLSLKDSTATGGAAWYAGANSTNVSGNLGWIFSNAPTGSYTITALNGTYTLNGQSVGIYRGRSLTSEYGSYALTGQSATLSRGFLLSPQNGLYSITGQAIDITYTPAPPVTGPTQYVIEIRSFTERRRI